VSFDCQGEPENIPMLIKNDIYRIGQEAITNAVRHAQASKVQVLLNAEGDQVELDVADDGRGFDKNTYQAGFGITGMKER
ncbi:ATP-binding protein, partial [Streptococcus pneumoniae]|nr:ATP-binding protein [Streptococcus pneumoniae]